MTRSLTWEDYQDFWPKKAGQILPATVAKNSQGGRGKDNYILFDIGLHKAPALLPEREYHLLEETAEGAPYQVYLQQGFNENSQTAIISLRQVAREQQRQAAEKLLNSQKTVKMTVESLTKGGLVGQIGQIDAFLPISKAKVKNRQVLATLVGQEIEVLVLEVPDNQHNVIVSEKDALLLQQEQVRDRLRQGKLVKGTITGLQDYGAFVDLGFGISGLIHQSRLGFRRSLKVQETLVLDQEIEARVVRTEERDGKTLVSLSLRGRQGTVYQEAAECYEIGQVLSGRVIEQRPYGAMIKILDMPQLRGLLHKSKAQGRIKELTEQQEIKVQILELDPDKKRLSLGLEGVDA